MGESPLIAALVMDAVETDKLLLQHGADAAATNPQGYTARDVAVNGGREEIAAMLEEPIGDAGSALVEDVLAF